MNYRTAQTADLPAMMKMVEEAKEGFRARNIDQWQKGEPNEQGLTEGIEKSVVHVLEENGEVLGMITESAYPRHTKEKDWLQASSLILRHLQKKRVSETFVSTPIRTISPCRKH